MGNWYFICQVRYQRADLDRFRSEGDRQRHGQAESEDNAASTVTLNLGSLITLTRPDKSTLVVANPVFTQISDFTAFDGVVDYAGTSGGSSGLKSSTASDSITSRRRTDFDRFSALGSIILNLDAIGASSANGAGNLDTKFQTFAGGRGTVAYNYRAMPYQNRNRNRNQQASASCEVLTNTTGCGAGRSLHCTASSGQHSSAPVMATKIYIYFLTGTYACKQHDGLISSKPVHAAFCFHDGRRRQNWQTIV